LVFQHEGEALHQRTQPGFWHRTQAAAVRVSPARRGWHRRPVDALGVKVVVEHAAQDLPNFLVEGEPPFPDDHRIPRLGTVPRADSPVAVETWVKTNMTRLHGRCPKGRRLVAKVLHGHRKTLTFVAGLRCDGIIAPCVFDGPIAIRIQEDRCGGSGSI
jgi:hypothetical protein